MAVPIPCLIEFSFSTSDSIGIEFVVSCGIVIEVKCGIMHNIRGVRRIFVE